MNQRLVLLAAIGATAAAYDCNDFPNDPDAPPIPCPSAEYECIPYNASQSSLDAWGGALTSSAAQEETGGGRGVQLVGKPPAAARRPR